MKLSTLLLFLFLKIVISAQTITTDRPTQTTGPTCVSKGVFQLETGALFSSINDYGSKELQLPTNLFRIGLGKGFELRMVNGITFTSLKNKINASFSDFELGMKLQLLNKEDKKTQIGIVVHGKTTTSVEMKGFYQRSINGVLAFNHILNSRNSISYNLGYKLMGSSFYDKKKELHSAFYTLNYSHSLTDRLGLFTELYGGIIDLSYIDFEDIGAFDFNFDMGLTWLVKDNIQLDYSFGYGIFRQMNFHSVGLSFFIAPKNK